MRDTILQILKDQGKTDVDSLAESCNTNVVTVGRELKAMKKKGIISYDPMRPRGWFYDMEFKCKRCERGYPDARRSSNEKVCRECHDILYPYVAKPVSRLRESEKEDSF